MLDMMRVKTGEDTVPLLLLDRDYRGMFVPQIALDLDLLLMYLGLPKCVTKAIYYRYNQAGLTETDCTVVFEKSGTALKLPKMAVIFEILKEKYTHKEFDRITEFSFPEMVWASNDGGIYTDYLRKAEMNLFSDYLENAV